MPKLSRAEREAVEEARRGPMLADLRLCCVTWRWCQFPKNGAPPRPNSALGSHLPEPEKEWWMVYGRAKVRIKRPTPTPEGLDAMDRWLPRIVFNLSREQRGAIFGTLGLGLGYRSCARMMGCSHEQVRRQREAALDILQRLGPT